MFQALSLLFLFISLLHAGKLCSQSCVFTIYINNKIKFINISNNNISEDWILVVDGVELIVDVSLVEVVDSKVVVCLSVVIVASVAVSASGLF
jgi:uncharacterized membrane protein YobD (UPF0266 family)